MHRTESRTIPNMDVPVIFSCEDTITFSESMYDNMHRLLPVREVHLSLPVQSFYLVDCPAPLKLSYYVWPKAPRQTKTLISGVIFQGIYIPRNQRPGPFLDKINLVKQKQKTTCTEPKSDYPLDTTNIL